MGDMQMVLLSNFWSHMFVFSIFLWYCHNKFEFFLTRLLRFHFGSWVAGNSCLCHCHSSNKLFYICIVRWRNAICLNCLERTSRPELILCLNEGNSKAQNFATDMILFLYITKEQIVLVNFSGGTPLCRPLFPSLRMYART